MATLVGTRVRDTYGDVLHLDNDGDGVTGSLTTVEDGRGQDTCLALSNAAARVTGNATVTGDLTVSGALNVASLTNALLSSSSITATGTTTARSLAARFAGDYNILDYGAVGNFSTDCATAINAAITAAAAAGGGVVYVPPASAAYRIASTITLKSNVFLFVDPAATIKLGNSANVTLVQSENFTTLTGTNSGSGVSNCGVIGYGVLDGNSANNTGPAAGQGHGIALYGRNFHICARVQNVRRRGLHTEYGTGAVGTSPFNGYIERLLVDTCGEDGWWNNVSDLHCSGANIKSASQNTDNTYDGIYLGTTGSIRGTNINVWSGGSVTAWPRAAMYLAGSGVTVTGVHLETGKTANLWIAGDGNQVDNLEAYNFKGAVNVRVTGSSNRVRGRLSRSTLGAAASVGVQLGISGDTAFGNVCDVFVDDHQSGLVDLTWSGGANTVYLTGGQDTGSAVAGWTLSSDLVFGRVSGTADAFLFGGRGDKSIQLGYGASAAAADTITIGRSCTSNTSGGFALGNQSACSASNTLAMGSICQAAASFATAWGQRAKGSIAGEHARATFMSSATGDRQESTWLLAANTTNATPTELSTTSVSSVTRLTLDDTSVLDVTISVTGVNTSDRTKVFRGTYKGAIKKDSTAGSTAFVNSGPASDVDAGNPAGWACAVTADTTNGALKVEVTGAAATNIAWLARVVGVKIVA